MLRVIERTFVSPEENLAFDDSLLTGGCEILRFWESTSYFVVLGRSGRAEREVHLDACAAAGVPVLRRSSGGGTVLQGPGCFNYALALSMEGRPELANVQESYRILQGEIARALGIPGLEVCGSDILMSGRKVSGSAQRRTGGWLLHHGTILHGLDVRLVAQFLQEPQRQPSHRNRRAHWEFLMMLPLAPPVIVRRLSVFMADWAVC